MTTEEIAIYERGREDGRRAERARCAGMASTLADLMRRSNRKKAAAELDMLARDIDGLVHLPVSP